MKKIVKLSLAVAMMSGIGAVSAQADGMNILSDVKLKGQIRARMETVSQDNALNDATAYTTRTKLVASAGLLEVEGLTANVGLTAVDNFDLNDYEGNPGNAGKTISVVADPEQAMVSVANIEYKTGDMAYHIGRSNINLDNQRFIGTVGWRQMDRSYDSFYGAYSKDNLNVLAAYVYGLQGVTSVTATPTESVLVNAAYKVSDEMKVTGYGYLLADNADTYGVALTGKVDAGVKLSYRAEYAMQMDATMDYDGAAETAVDGTY